MEPKIVRKSAFTVVGLRRRGKNESAELARLWRRFIPRSDQIKDRVNPAVTFGLIGNFDDASGEFDYMAGVEVNQLSDFPEGMERWDVPEQKYAVFACELPNLMETLDHAYKTWLPESDYRRGEGPEFEYYGADFDPEDPCSIMYVYIPVE